MAVVRALFVPADLDDEVRVMEVECEDFTIIRGLIGATTVEEKHVSSSIVALWDEDAGYKTSVPTNHLANMLLRALNRPEWHVLGNVLFVGPPLVNGYRDIPEEFAAATVTRLNMARMTIAGMDVGDDED